MTHFLKFSGIKPQTFYHSWILYTRNLGEAQQGCIVFAAQYLGPQFGHVWNTWDCTPWSWRTSSEMATSVTCLVPWCRGLKGRARLGLLAHVLSYHVPARQPQSSHASYMVIHVPVSKTDGCYMAFYDPSLKRHTATLPLYSVGQSDHNLAQRSGDPTSQREECEIICDLTVF